MNANPVSPEPARRLEIAPVLQARSLTVSFGGVRALDGLDLSVQRGEIYALLGANGAGKTTTLKLFLGFIKPTSGQALVCGHDVASDVQAARRRLLYIPEQVALYAELSGLENLDYFCRLGGVTVPQAVLRDALSEAGLESTAFERRAGAYSKGMRQKVGVALALLKNADALLLDEPTSGLDPKASTEFHSLISGLRDRGAAVLMATHDLYRARAVADRIGVMRGGVLRRELRAGSVDAAELEALYLGEMA
jgi:ABC-2 type transport system ATP-binding protein